MAAQLYQGGTDSRLPSRRSGVMLDQSHLKSKRAHEGCSLRRWGPLRFLRQQRHRLLRRQCNHTINVLGCGDRSNAGRDVELQLNGAAVVRQGNEKARTGGIPQSYAVTERIMDRRLGVPGHTTALDEVKESASPSPFCSEVMPWESVVKWPFDAS
ncbi:endonuclease/exonuclease/phosphatase family protein [Babesia caballi]|uniref:Endonuclease/exonuclease/phosphatase family protein n=1 Tax=Babesia caballi TaxID=5871 RepID=A0AAV4LYK1_BABCB|nr:endonuclease/exonuclease/phosphatase family protein [Babesia caballi]